VYNELENQERESQIGLRQGINEHRIAVLTQTAIEATLQYNRLLNELSRQFDDDHRVFVEMDELRYN
jgi:flavoprotein